MTYSGIGTDCFLLIWQDNASSDKVNRPATRIVVQIHKLVKLKCIHRNMRKLFIRLGSLLGLTAVILGAFGAHALEATLDSDQIEVFRTGVTYHFYHALALLGVGILLHFGRKAGLIYAGYLFLVGVVFFSGSLYLLATRSLHQLPVSWLGPVTPIGGTLLIIGWGFLFVSTFYHFDRQQKS